MVKTGVFIFFKYAENTWQITVYCFHLKRSILDPDGYAFLSDKERRCTLIEKLKCGQKAWCENYWLGGVGSGPFGPYPDPQPMKSSWAKLSPWLTIETEETARVGRFLKSTVYRRECHWGGILGYRLRFSDFTDICWEVSLDPN